MEPYKAPDPNPKSKPPRPTRFIENFDKPSAPLSLNDHDLLAQETTARMKVLEVSRQTRLKRKPSRREDSRTGGAGTNSADSSAKRALPRRSRSLFRPKEKPPLSM